MVTDEMAQSIARLLTLIANEGYSITRVIVETDHDEFTIRVELGDRSF